MSEELEKPINSYGLKKPCNNCPFRNDGKAIKLSKGRLEDIATSLVDDDSQVFPCHKTNLSESKVNHYCYGAMKFLMNEGRPSVSMRFAHAFGYLDLNDLDKQEAPIIKSIEETKK